MSAYRCVPSLSRQTIEGVRSRPCRPGRRRPFPGDDGSSRGAHSSSARIRAGSTKLRAEHDLSLAEYDALLTIADAPERRIRMRQLADRVILSKSGVTRLIDRLVLDGLSSATRASRTPVAPRRS